MSPVKNIKGSRRSLSALRLLAAVLSTFVFAASASAQLAPILTLNSPVSLFDFGRVNLGAETPAQVITLSNSGNANLIISDIAVTGDNPDDFQLNDNTCVGIKIAPGGTCTLTASFKPGGVGFRSARLTVDNNAAGSQHLVPFQGVGLDPNVPNRNVGPVDPRHGFPLWYQDDQGVRLTLCLDTNGLCVEPPPNPNLPPSVTDTLVNFPGETFWWSAEAEIDLPGDGEATLVLAQEAAFTVEEAAVGKQISFGRVRVRIDDALPFTTYTITHPFGSLTVTTDEDGEVTETEDIGCGAAPCDFRAALNSQIGVFLRWDPAVAPAAPDGYLGDPRVEHAITGSPLNQNFFRVNGPNVGGPGVHTIQTGLFSLQGKIFKQPRIRFIGPLEEADASVESYEMEPEK